ncbi:YncE family protein [Solihabitans fulvus]|uniref:YncE family protein n=1 Tax=Solihabitans fulvus TaxID=1892852 RepID=A0A5B2WU77_9PSEU|nr:YncE family protein [Solihabitans fulvus]KAA2254424.1 YncE family protein [Solihabitans fulvus]
MNRHRATVATLLAAALAGATCLAATAAAEASTATVRATLALGKWTSNLKMSPDGRFGYFPNDSDGTVSVLDTSTNQVTPVRVDQPGPTIFDVAISPDSRHVYAPDAKKISVIDEATQSVSATITVPDPPDTEAGLGILTGAVVSPDGHWLYVSQYGRSTQDEVDNGRILVIDTATNQITGETDLDFLLPVYLSIAPDGHELYLSANGSGSLRLLDATSNPPTPAGTLAGRSGTGISVPLMDPVHNCGYVAGPGGVLDRLDLTTHALAQALPAFGDGSGGIAITPDGTRMFLGHTGQDSVSVVDLNTGTLLDTVTGFGLTPANSSFQSGLLVGNDSHTIYVSGGVGWMPPFARDVLEVVTLP